MSTLKHADTFHSNALTFMQTPYDSFISTVNTYYQNNRRSFTWREEISPYRVFISEVMLQQTQTYRVEPKFNAFVERFDSFESLAAAPFAEVLSYWKGLGYNRRALNLQKAAQAIVTTYQGILPDDEKALDDLPGIGPATAASIVCYAFNKPTMFIETNIRTVYIYHFFPGRTDVSDKELIPLVNATVHQTEPREWYYALMDYGVHLKKTVGNVSRASKHYTKQSTFEGSHRQVRGKILEVLLHQKQTTQEILAALLMLEESKIEKALAELVSEGLVKQKATLYTL